MKTKIIDHPFFDEGTILFVVDGEMVFLSPCNDKFQLWITCKDYIKENLNHFLDECRDGKHSASGSGMIGTFKEMINEISQLNAN